MSDKAPINVVICWHMHQPQYHDLGSGRYFQPWTYLHAVKDYVDMAAHLEQVPAARAVVNFAPILLEQLDDYRRQVAAFNDGTAMTISDPLLEALGSTVLPADDEARMQLIHACLRANQERLIDRFPAYKLLARVARWMLKHPAALGYLDDQFLIDLLVWYHLAWTGETVRRQDLRIQRLQDKGHHFSLQDRRELMQVIGEILDGLLPRYRALAEAGRVELAFSPYAHPIVPLLLEMESARQAMPEAPLPDGQGYPGGEARAVWHIRKGKAVFERFFGFVPAGCWPSEGGVSDATLRLLEQEGIRWAATGESVLHHSLKHDDLHKDDSRETALFQPWHLPDGELACFFRDDGLSDAVGFNYSDWHADDAVANLVHHLENIAAASPDPQRHVVSIILDGENAWEYYPENGYYFLHALYSQLAAHPGINLSTFSDCLDRGVEVSELKSLVAGSWVYGSFSTWIGDPDKNRGWEMLIEAKEAVDRVLAGGGLSPEQREKIELQLAICEGSDWFWWFGDYNPSDSVQDFDSLFRLQLANLYQLLGETPPEYLAHAFSFGARDGEGPARGGVMRQGQQ
ncbi:MAG: glycoside hydrolase [Gammaproteobacteria bacterium]|nr:glycoside hydrolase [Gammaproteobacteria bacterium]